MFASGGGAGRYTAKKHRGREAGERRKKTELVNQERTRDGKSNSKE